ncbi:hypothetical protein F4780DRAFT_544152 [Xylariomycetidae sp. FL0641]|nr:hypothetical protein F4780DRAFT_544152 [Xylariomycetidae sp. FL0641]
MADESYASATTSTANVNARRLSGNPSSGPGLHRAATFGQPGQAGQLRRRSTLNATSPTTENPNPNPNAFADLRRRSSTYSDFSLSDARRDLETSADELLNPSRSRSSSRPTPTKAPFAYVPLALALLPAVAGKFFDNGSAFFTDLILLSLAAVFLHWSVTQPWDWYQSAQQVRIVREEIMTEPVFESDSDLDSPTTPSVATALENVPEETQKDEAGKSASKEPDAQWEPKNTASIRELYLHEILALAWCFIFPMLGAYLLHTIRGQLSRPSEGLVSDYNLTIFLCAAEIRPVSHLLKMIQDRTVHVQRIVAQHPHRRQSISSDKYEALSRRLEELEGRSNAGQNPENGSAQPEIPQRAIEVAVSREVRSAVQPELDALNRAMRRYEKKMTLLACQMDNRLEYVEYRLNDAIALAAVAAKNSNAQGGLTTWLFERLLTIVIFPVQGIMAVLTFPFRTATTLFGRKSRPPPERPQRSSRNGKLPAQGRNYSDRQPARMSRR